MRPISKYFLSALFALVFAFNSVAQVLFPISVNHKDGYIDKSGKVIVEPKYDKTFPFRNGLGRFQEEGKTGFLNASGKVVIEAQFDRATDFNDGLAAVSNGGKWSFIDEKGAVKFEVNC
ncbi:MAG TPA: hypothetical protein DCD96_02980, partial [Flavobacteriales bacterium]|nr:hypothetical protein [Flavobacteriales bacterium]